MNDRLPAYRKQDTVLVKVTVDVRGIESVDGFNEALLRRRFDSSPETRVGPMPKLRPKCQIALRVHPDDVAELTAYSDSLQKPKALK
jgi:hypothetical protein